MALSCGATTLTTASKNVTLPEPEAYMCASTVFLEMLDAAL